ncbi:MAG: hypothetical protein NZM08_09830, partial [Chitinophagales bacterium]|nr:hypothetical protein [Chitinophagales bacterium]
MNHCSLQHLLRSGMMIALLLSMRVASYGEAHYVYHEQTTSNPGCGSNNYMSTTTPTNAAPLTIAWKTEYQFYTNQLRVYYTTDGSTPCGSFGVPTGTTQVITGSYSCIFTFAGNVVDVCTATIPAQPAGTVVKYIISAWHSGGGAEIFANGPGSPCGCGTPTSSCSMATVFSYTVAASGTNPVEVVATSGTTLGTYATLKGAFDAINAGTHKGTITINIWGNTNEGTATAALNASGSGAASYSSILIRPQGGAARTISGNTAAGNPLIDLNGADNVTINGLNTGGNALTIVNTTVSSTSGTATIRFINGATSNLITNCNLRGAGTMNVATNGAVVFFSTDGSTPNGNDNNTISFCNIGPSGSDLPTKGILGNGSTTTTTIHNSGIIIDNNNIFDYFSASVTSAGLAINGGCNSWTITNNRFYQTAPRVWTTGAEHCAILFNNSGATSGPFSMTVTGNIIGFANASGTGTYALSGTTGSFRGIRFNGPTGAAVSDISNNTIANISLTGVTSSGTGTNAPFFAILINNGLVNTNNNTIGSQTSTGSLVFSTNTGSSTDVYGIYNFSLDDWTANNNNLGGISVTNAGTGTTIFYGLRANTTTSKAFNCSGNLIGGTVSGSISLNASSTGSQVIGINTSNAVLTATSNVIRNMTTNAGTGTGTSASLIGISCNAVSVMTHTVSQNQIYNLSNTHLTAASTVTGILFTGPGSPAVNVVERNLIYGLTVSTTSSSAEVTGIRTLGGSTVFRNNMIALGADISHAIGAAASNISTTGINGIVDASGTNNFYHNSVYIGGTATAGSGASYAFNSTLASGTRNYRDNILVNAR